MDNTGRPQSLGKTKLFNFFTYLSIGSKPGKIPELDGLRALAILMVVFHHFATFYKEQHGSYFNSFFPEFIRQFLFNGWLGVDLFFVLSGYLICHHLIAIQNQPNKTLTYGHYALKRVLRTFPLYYAIILLIAFGLIPFYPSQITATDYWIHLLFLQDYLGAHILVPLWSLASEEKFYLLAPFLMLLINQMSPAKAVALLLAFILLMLVYKSMLMSKTEQTMHYILFFTEYRAPFHYAITSILTGVVVALLVEMPKPRRLTLLTLIAGTMITITLFSSNLYNPNHWFWLNILHFLVVLLFGVLVWSAVKNTGLPFMRVLTSRTLRIISVLSYSLYLAHYTVLPWVYRLHKQHIQSEEAWIHATSFFIIYVTISAVFSLLLHYLVEKPFLILKNRL